MLSIIRIKIEGFYRWELYGLYVLFIIDASDYKHYMWYGL
jgi:hypothetical protein